MNPLKNSNTDSNKPNNERIESSQSSFESTSQQGSTNTATLCVVCSTRIRALVLVPCGHYNVCVPCGHSLTQCPNCRANVTALVRIYE